MIVDQNNFDISVFHDAEGLGIPFKSKGQERKRHLYKCIPCATLPGHVMEFGVYQGKTMFTIANHFRDQTCWGFDSFVGLPEAWYTTNPDVPSHPAGHFDLSQSDLPIYRHNVKLVKGWFNESIPPWLVQHPGDIRFLHVDCDLYSSTKTVLDLLNDRIKPGTVIVFDEMYPWGGPGDYTLWEQGEYRALKEWLYEQNRAFRTLFRSRHQQCSIVSAKMELTNMSICLPKGQVALSQILETLCTKILVSPSYYEAYSNTR